MRRHAYLVCSLIALLVVCTAAFAQQLAKRLILKDGSYQLATKWQIKGDRVRYYSPERSEWEEVPKSMVDWAATEKYERDRSSGVVATDAVKQADAEEEAERAAEEAKSPTVAPGIRLPSQGGVFLLDQFAGQPQLVEVVQNGSELNRNTTGNILRATINPLAGSKQTIELAGLHAQIQSHLTQPAIYVNIEPEPPEATKDSKSSPPLDPAERFRLVRLDEKTRKNDRKSGARVVSNYKIAFYGKVKEQQTIMPATVQPVSGGWLKIVPEARLAPGEYALLEVLGPKAINSFVWDFGVNPAAPANSGSWKPVQPQTSQTGSNDSPVLQGRPKK